METNTLDASKLQEVNNPRKGIRTHLQNVVDDRLPQYIVIVVYGVEGGSSGDGGQGAIGEAVAHCPQHIQLHGVFEGGQRVGSSRGHGG